MNSGKEAWDALEKLYITNTRARKIQLKNELNNMKKSRGMYAPFKNFVLNL